jgi:hypothetical protein
MSLTVGRKQRFLPAPHLDAAPSAFVAAKNPPAPIPADKEPLPHLKTKAQAYVAQYNDIARRQQSGAISAAKAKQSHDLLNASLDTYSKNLGISYSNNLLGKFNSRARQANLPADTPVMNADMANYYDVDIAHKLLTGGISHQEALRQHNQILDCRVQAFRKEFSDIEARQKRGEITTVEAARREQAVAQTVKDSFRRLSKELGTAHQNVILRDVHTMLAQKPPRRQMMRMMAN